MQFLRLRSGRLAAVVIVAGFALNACGDGTNDKPKSANEPVTFTMKATEDWQAIKAKNYCRDQSNPKASCLADDSGNLVALAWAGGAGNGVWVWDQGGPGLGLPGVFTDWIEAIPEALTKHNVVMVVEPWLSNGIPGECLDSERMDGCDLQPLESTDDRTQSIVKRLSDERGWEPEGLYLNSFGVTRGISLLETLGVDQAIMQTPAPPKGHSALSLLNDRSRAISEGLASMCGSKDCESRFPKAFEQVLSEGIDGVASGQEMALGLHAAVTRLDDNAGFLEDFVSATVSGSVNDQQARRLKVLGRTYKGYSGDDPVASTVGMWADICPAFTEWKKLRSPDLAPLTKAGADLYQPCLEGAGAAPHGEVDLPTDTRLLLVEGVNDPVVPITTQRSWRDLLVDNSFEVVQGNAHGDQSDAVVREISAWIEKG